MLTPLEETLKLQPHKYNELVNALRKTVLEYKDTQQLRAHIVKTLSKFVEPDHKRITGS